MPDPDHKPNLYAILIGVDCYLPNKLPDGSSYDSLEGCVNDITQVEQFLNTRLTVTRTIKLTASGKGAKPAEASQDLWPTKKNIKQAFDDITVAAQKGDLVYIHYSGHGGRAKTCFAELKGANGLDEGLVPTDIGSSSGNYLRDLEIAYLLQTMVDKGLLVTLVLDSCHSGGATRGTSGARKRGITSPDMRAPDEVGLIAPKATLLQMWHATAAGQRSAKADSGWLPEPRGYVLMAACAASQLATEFPFDGKTPSGALTHWMLSALNQLDGQLTYQMLYDRILGKVTTQFSDQTPQLQGERNRVVFGVDQRPSKENRITILSVDKAGDGKTRLLLNAGPGLSVGAKFAVFPLATVTVAATNTGSDSQRIAIAELESITPDGMQSWANITDVIDHNAVISAGGQAGLITPGTIQLASTVRLFKRADLLANIGQTDALKAAQDAIQSIGEGWVNISEEEASDFQVVVNAKAEYEIWDAAGQAIALRPALSCADPKAAQEIAKRLIHLTRYNSIKQMSSDDATSALAGKLKVEVLKGDKTNPQPFENPNTRVVKSGEKITLKLTSLRPKVADNLDVNVMYITILDLQPDWGVTLLLDAKEINPGEDKVFGFTMELSDPSIRSCVDTIKVFGTTKPADFSWLTLPALDQAPQPEQIAARSATRGSWDALAQLFAKVAVDRPATRQVKLNASASAEWVSVQVDIRTEAQS